MSVARRSIRTSRALLHTRTQTRTLTSFGLPSPCVALQVSSIALERKCSCSMSNTAALLHIDGVVFSFQNIIYIFCNSSVAKIFYFFVFLIFEIENLENFGISEWGNFGFAKCPNLKHFEIPKLHSFGYF